MDFLTASILSGILWDFIKEGSIITAKKVKSAIKDFVLDESNCEIIVEEINKAPQSCKETQKALENFIGSNKKILNIIKQSKLVKSTINFENNEINGPINNGNVENQTINYNKKSL